MTEEQAEQHSKNTIINDDMLGLKRYCLNGWKEVVEH